MSRLLALRLCLLATLTAAGAVRRVLVTGANKGIGLQICKKIVATQPDAHVVLGSRSASRGEKAVADVLASEPSAAGRVEMLQLDVSDEASVAAAASELAARYPSEPTPLHGLCNNAGVGFGRSIRETLATNFYGSVRCCAHFVPLIEAEGRVCNVASASGPNFVRGLDAEQKAIFTSRATSWEALDACLQRYAESTDYEGVAYGLSKAAVNQWTMQLAAEHPQLRVNSCSPGYILTDLTAGMGATKRPEESNCHVAPLYLLFGDVPHPETNKGRYYGSDAVRSPIDVYRGPGDPPYEGD